MKKNSKKTEASLYAALFRLIEQKGWAGFDMNDVARESGWHRADILHSRPDKYALLCGFGRHMDEVALAQFEESDVPLKEKLFDILMLRFDVLQAHRGGIIRLMNDLRAEPVSAALVGFEASPQLCASMQRMVQAAGVYGGTVRSFALSIGLKLVYLATLRVWKNDDSRDMAATMAALDRNLERMLKLTPSMA